MQAPVKGQKMEVADLDEAQSKKVFRARKTMKISDRQQLESIHNSHSSSALSSSTGATSSSTPPPAVVNGKDPEEEQTVGDSHTDTNPKETRPTPPASRTPSPLTLSLSLSPSPPSQSPQLPSGSNACLSPAHSPKSAENESDREEGDGEGEKERPSVAEGVKTADEKMDGGEVKEKEDSAGPQVEDKEDENPKPEGDVSSPLDSPHDPTISPASPTALESKDEESKTETGKRTESEEAVAMDTGLAPMEIEALEDNKSIPATDMVSSSSPSPSPSHAPESDLEVKEGFLVLSEEDENQGEKDEEKDKQEVKEIESGEEMDVDVKKDEEKEHVSDTAPPSPTSSPATPPTGDPEADTDHSTLSGKKRTLCADLEMDRENEGEEVVREGKRQKVEGEELEAQLELKIRADTSSRHKLEKVVQQLVEEQLRVLQLSVFDRSLQELRERVEKIDCATKHQQTLNSLQAKIARLAKKFGAANQTKENIRKPLEGTLLTPTMTTPTSTASTTSTFRSVRTTMDSKQSNQSPATRSLSSTASPAQPKPLSTPAPPASSPLVSAAVPLLITTTTTTTAAAAAASDTTSSVSGLAPVASQNQTGTLLLKTSLGNGAVAQSPAPASAPQPVSLQPLLIQLPLAGSVVTGRGAGVELVPVSSLGASVSTLSKAKTTTAATFILQKGSPSSSAPSLPSAPALPQITIARAVYPGGGGTVSVPSSGVSVSTARTPTQCASVAGVTSSSSLPVTSAPAATGGLAASAPPSATVMASKTDNQATNSAVSKPPVQVSRASSSRAVIDLTEDDDDVQVTGVQRAPVQSGLNAASSVSPATQRSTGAPPPLISSSTALGPATGSTMRSSPLGGLHSVNGPPLTVPYRSPQNSPSKVRPANPNPSPQQLPPLPSPPPAPVRLPPEAAHTSLPQQPQLKLTRVQNQNGIVLSWCVEEPDRGCAAVDSYHLYAYHRDQAAAAPQPHWKKIGEVKALPLPMACTLTQFVSGSTYYFAVCARDIYSRFGPFCEPQCTDVVGSSSG
ncbi:activating transcription factor 7-interacting protein 1 isoform X3 [Anguilla anguilla]|uniref:activating transcription factor 7-interacting protein 1 isoform X3 n=1 Tax=Anguilla anguilla TaxID=7936 RepID=UPI0015A97C4E|nr:activating transcription factor 7-interacting protein 1 isoform X3 [Anguilla anguilla]